MPRVTLGSFALAAVDLLRRRLRLVTGSDRGAIRYRRVGLSAAASVGARAVATVTGLVSVPLTVNYLGVERYGVWATMSSMLAMLTFSDFGLGNGLLNALSEANGRDDRVAARIYVSTALVVMLALATMLGITVVVAWPVLRWPSVLNVASEDVMRDAGTAMGVLVACFLAGLPIGIIPRVQMAYQEGYINSLWGALGNVLGLVGLLVVIHFRGGLPWLVLALVGGPLTATLVNGLLMFRNQRPWLIPSLRCVSLAAAKRILQLGAGFFGLQLAVAFAYSSDNLVAAHVLGVDAVATYATALKLFSVAPMVANMVLTPLWPAYTEAIERGDLDWVRATLRRSLLLTTAMTAVPSLVLALFGRELIRLWVGPAVQPGRDLLIALALWSVVSSTGNAVAMFLNGASVLGPQVALSVLMTVFAVVGKVWFARWWGLSGIVWATLLAYLIFSAVPLLVLVPRTLARLRPSTVTSVPTLRLQKG